MIKFVLMKKLFIEQYIKQGESETVEFKENFGEDVIETLCAFANTEGGIVLDVVSEIRATFDDIDKTQVKEFVRLANEKKRRAIPPNTSIPELFEKLDLAHKGELTRAAVLLFGKNPQKYYSQASFKVGRFRNETLIVDDKIIDGNLFQQVDGVMGYFGEKLETRFEKTVQL